MDYIFVAFFLYVLGFLLVVTVRGGINKVDIIVFNLVILIGLILSALVNV